ncbi:MAG: large conductance mechanosensitive channel protein MscL [Dehalococcoidia bacterium]
MFDEFKRFLLRGNVVELGIAVVMGVGFKSVTDAMVTNLMTPLIAAVGGNADFSALTFSLNGSEFLYGNFINTVISFVITALVVFFFIITPMNHMMDRYAEEETPDPTTKKCRFCFSEIALRATRCPQCTSELPAAA